MAKQALINRQKKRRVLNIKYSKKRTNLKKSLKKAHSLNEKLIWHFKLQQLPLDSSSVRLHNRCLITGRPKGYFRFFGLSRHLIRELAHQGLLPGVVKASW